MLKKTKIITNTYWIVNSTYTVSYTDRCTSCTISIDHPFGASLDNWKGGGGYIKKHMIVKGGMGGRRHFFPILDRFKKLREESSIGS